MGLISRWPSRLRAAWNHKAVRYNELIRDFEVPPKVSDPLTASV